MHRLIDFDPKEKDCSGQSAECGYRWEAQLFEMRGGQAEDGMMSDLGSVQPKGEESTVQIEVHSP